MQGAWLASAKFAGLTSEQDPLLGNREPFPVPPDQPDAASVPTALRGPPPSQPCRRAAGLPQFVTVKGGAYFFMPGLAALRWVASL